MKIAKSPLGEAINTNKSSPQVTLSEDQKSNDEM